MGVYYISYGTGAGNKTIKNATLSDAKAVADNGAAYTQHDISIYRCDDTGNPHYDEFYSKKLPRGLIAVRHWHSVGDSDNYNDAIGFGKFGFYSDWESF